MIRDAVLRDGHAQARQPLLAWRVRRWSLLGVDVMALVAGLALASAARRDFDVRLIDRTGLLFAAAVIAAAFVAMSLTLRLPQGRHTVGSAEESTALAVAVTVAAIVTVAADLVTGPPRVVPLSVPVVGAALSFVLMLGLRLVVRHQRQAASRRRAGVPTLVFGAGVAGGQLIRSMTESVGGPYVPVGVLDDDLRKRHARVHGVRMMGGREDIAAVAGATGAELLVIALPSADASTIRDISQRATDAGLAVKVLPRLSEIVGSQVGIRDVRDIDIADLLGRRQVDTNVRAIADYLVGKRVLVTGAGGSIGSELCLQLARFHPAELIMLDRDESALHALQLQLHGEARLDAPEVVLADIRDSEQLTALFAERRPEVVFHAAALKHVNMLETHSQEAWKTNVLGTRNVLEAATAVRVERFINISTDKAADPVNVLGRTKRLAEQLTAAYARANDGAFLSVRFGNVLGSRGSVLTTFTAQIARGGPVTVTDPDVTRYFMTIPEAVQLVIQAGAIGRDGEALVLDMGEPVRIADVARQLIALADRPIDIVYTGLHPGEKLHEELFGENETGTRAAHPLITHVPVPPLEPAEIGRMGRRAEDRVVASPAASLVGEWADERVMEVR
ncbi:NDP-sugar epimerase, includes UDP-GlcNAc-inverting 4,6-dehydratase FlaA1 and capsular polysaccharide biosynthesis protein EpsC [Modestobacter sp. DSM 44400]|uniref:polysaccharide biosynthesis protein n=1 Tax=Modestobacter sp. DSM 44400 TaxID=1550230 RepID=UPI000894CFCB|nr:nucleoside-diphosphate sugar epimerase/dehydratase [Modestobacter sp. DSM 44400]SDY75667.1 NDP-sugar epimerase, includes UDP-GlcNAc-inverting 4,6-dehydratase FlaA1 and capsular polysaccharide biosynthesis protein EpsC [Modestobacter sp. DSM 44400]